MIKIIEKQGNCSYPIYWEYWGDITLYAKELFGDILAEGYIFLDFVVPEDLNKGIDATCDEEVSKSILEMNKKDLLKKYEGKLKEQEKGIKKTNNISFNSDSNILLIFTNGKSIEIHSMDFGYISDYCSKDNKI